jgi:hypothetical protein
MNRKKGVLLGTALVLLTGGILYWRLTSSPPSHADATPPGSNSTSEAEPAKPGSNPKPETEEQKTRRMLLGVWQDEYKGKRTMKLNEDGTGTMDVQLSGWQATLFASKLHFDMKWSRDGKTLTKRTVRGEPADKVNLILNTMGDTAKDTILELTEDRLLLLDKDGKTKYDWKRPKRIERKKGAQGRSIIQAEASREVTVLSRSSCSRCA